MNRVDSNTYWMDRVRAAKSFEDMAVVVGEALARIVELELANADQRYQIEKLIYRRDHPGEL